MKELKAPAFAALALAFASFGDAFLYPYLPVNNLSVGIPVAWVGVLLSINRFVRIISNGLMVDLFTKFGLRTVMILAAALAITSTIGYAFSSTVVAWLLFRICWGLSFSAMRIGTLGYALQHSKHGVALGVSRGLQEAGPMAALFIAPFLLSAFDARTIFILLSTISLPALYFAFNLPRVHDRTPTTSSKLFFKLPSSANAITFVSAILIDGIVIVVLGILFLRYKEGITPLLATTMAAFYLGYRRICLVVLSPAGGWIADRIGLPKVFNVSIALVLIGLTLLTFGWISVGAIVVFTFYSIHAAITPGSVSKGQPHSLAAVAENATWRDMGAAIGTLLGGFLLTSNYLGNILLLLIFLLFVLLLVHLGTARKALNYLFLWK
jgi:MFS transporter, DHA1 family, multidrug resistance protein